MATLVIIDLNSQASFEFQYFPKDFEEQAGANWEPQNTTSGKKPLFYANGEPGRLTFSELWFDESITNQSLSAVISGLKTFCLEEQEDRGAPPAMLVTWGDEKFQGVLTRMTVNRNYFTRDEGNVIRAKFSLEFLEIQDEGEATNLVGLGT